MIGCNTKVPYQKFKLNHPPVISPSKMSYGKEHHSCQRDTMKTQTLDFIINMMGLCCLFYILFWLCGLQFDMTHELLVTTIVCIIAFIHFFFFVFQILGHHSGEWPWYSHLQISWLLELLLVVLYWLCWLCSLLLKM